MKAPNGNTSYLETYYEMVAGFYSNPESPVLNDIENEQGRGGMWEFAEELTNEFESLHEGREWDGEFYDTIDEFINSKLY